MARLISYPLSVLYYLLFGFTLILFDGIQRICYFIFGIKAHRKSVIILNFLLLRCLNILGTRFVVDYSFNLEKNQSYIFVANHQSTYDIPPLIWYLRKAFPVFVGKKELGKGIPSISFNLKYGGAVLIDRKNPKEALKDIKAFGERLVITNGSVVIFPEGTRSNGAKPRAFQLGGIKQLINAMPQAKLVGITINNSWKLSRNGYFPMGIGAKIKIKMHPPMNLPSYQVLETLEQLEKTIIADINS
ncbi:MAG: 1-acyl-sn-glycerol-3-phosphate acyltransferase [Flavobacteriaceae bacterium]|nr:1-acyl-sn-glycerol-3-phosphate acyltransferase [Flavobacteriaceae bacterium]